MAHLFLSVSGHGFGHLAQVSPLINALVEADATLKITLQSDLPAAFVRRRLTRFDHWHRWIPDTGMVMHNALDVDAGASLVAYRRMAGNQTELLERQMRLLESAQPDLLIADVPHLPLLAAQRLGIPNVAVCSLNWADILEAYCDSMQGAGDVIGGLREIYAAADLFIRPAPALPMDWLPNGVDVGPIIQGGASRREALVEALGVDPEVHLVMINLGGITTPLDVGSWSVPDGQCWICPADWAAANGDLVDYQGLVLPFSEVLASVDVLVTKPGYGMFTEAALHGTPVLTVERGDWPEEPVFDAWMRQRLNYRVLPRKRFDRGDFAGEVAALARLGRRQPTPATGIDEALGLLAPWLG